VIEIASGRLDHRLAGGMSGLHEEFEALRAELRAIERRITRFMFVLWITQIAVTFGILLAFFRS
jgi:hypothetical protein